MKGLHRLIIAVLIGLTTAVGAGAENKYELNMVDKFQKVPTGTVIPSRASLENALYNTVYDNELLWNYLNREDRRALLEKIRATISSGLGLKVRIPKIEKLRNVEIQFLPFDNGSDQIVVIGTNLTVGKKGFETVSMDKGVGWIFKMDGEHLALRTFLDPPTDLLAKIDAAIEKNPGNLDLWMVRAEYYDMFDQRQAVKEYEKIIEKFPDADGAYNNLAMLYTGYINLNLLDPEKAVAFALKACELTKYQEVGHVDTLARAYFVKGDYLKALELTRENLKKSDQIEIKLFLELMECNPPTGKGQEV